MNAFAAEVKSLRAAWGLAALVGVTLGVSALGHRRVVAPRTNAVRMVDFALKDATLAELQLIPDVGPVLARTIHQATRVQRNFTVEDLSALQGIGPVRCEALSQVLVPSIDARR